MENWSSSLKEFYLLNKREIKRYGICALLVAAGLNSRDYVIAWLGLGAAIIMFAFDRWGRPYAERGKEIMNRNKPKPPTP